MLSTLTCLTAKYAMWFVEQGRMRWRGGSSPAPRAEAAIRIMAVLSLLYGTSAFLLPTAKHRQGQTALHAGEYLALFSLG